MCCGFSSVFALPPSVHARRRMSAWLSPLRLPSQVRHEKTRACRCFFRSFNALPTALVTVPLHACMCAYVSGERQRRTGRFAELLCAAVFLVATPLAFFAHLQQPGPLLWSAGQVRACVKHPPAGAADPLPLSLCVRGCVTAQGIGEHPRVALVLLRSLSRHLSPSASPSSSSSSPLVYVCAWWRATTAPSRAALLHPP